jgi:ABC-2 type transport system permease protein
MVGYGCANTAFAGIAISIVIRRENAVLKRLRSTPLPAHVFLLALLASTMVVFALETVLLFLLGRAFFGTPFPSHVVSLVLAILLGGAAFAALGVAAAALIRSAEGSSAAINVILLPMAFLSGSFGPTRHYPHVLRAIGDVLPLKYFVDIVDAIYLHHREIWDKPAAVAVVAAWGVGGLLVALRRFRWEPVEG